MQNVAIFAVIDSKLHQMELSAFEARGRLQR